MKIQHKNFLNSLFIKGILTFSMFLGLGSALYAKTANNDDGNGGKNSCYNDPAVKEIKNVIDKILVELEKHKSEVSGNSQLVYKIIDELMVPKADFKVMSSLVLTRNWKKLSDEQKKNFIREFSRLIIRTYGVAFEAYNGETVDVHCPLRKLSDKNDRVEVSSTIHHLKQPENLVKFRLIKISGSSGEEQKNNAAESEKCDTCKTIKQECKDLYTKCSGIKNKVEKDSNTQAEQLKQDYASCKTEYDQCKSKYNTCKNDCGKDSDTVSNSSAPGNSVWKVYDLIVDNVSIIDSYRQVFADKFRKQSDVEKIIADMQQKNCEKNKSFCNK